MSRLLWRVEKAGIVFDAAENKSSEVDLLIILPILTKNVLSEVVHAVTKGIINELLQGPITYVRSGELSGNPGTLLHIEQLFMLGKP